MKKWIIKKASKTKIIKICIEKSSKNNKYDQNNDKMLQKHKNLQNVKIRGLQKTFFPVS